MSPKLPRLTAGEVERALERVGFRLVRQSGSHRIYRNDEGRRVTLPFHSSRILHPKLLKAVLREAGLTEDDFR